MKRLASTDRLPRTRRAQRALLLTAAPTLAVIATGAAAFECASSEDTSVDIVSACDPAKLGTSPAEATVKEFVQTSADLLTRAQSLESRFKDVCNAMNADLGQPAGNDLRGACNKLAVRFLAAAQLPPIPDGGVLRPVWVNIGFNDTCTFDHTVEPKCVDGCSGQPPCDPIAACDPQTKVASKCAGNCGSTCDVIAAPGSPVACKNQCSGTCDMPGDAGTEGGPPAFACAAECTGKCLAPTWTARCTGGCNKGFLGKCEGTCTGSCDGKPIAPPGFPPDAGADAGDGGEAGAGPPAVAPTGADGNCPGTCGGQCSSNASGTCAAPCTGTFSAGACAGLGTCIGACAGTTGCLTTCDGTCTSPAGACTGICRGSCDQGATDKVCEGTLNCPGGDLCKAICRVKGALTVKCTPPGGVNVQIAGDFALYDAFKKHAAEFGQLVNELTKIQFAAQVIYDRTAGEFRTAGLVSDVGFKCVDQASQAITQVRTTLNSCVSASQITTGQSF